MIENLTIRLHHFTRTRRRWIGFAPLLFVAACIVSACVVSACAPPKSLTVGLPSGAKAPAVTDSSFIALIDSLALLDEDIGLVCVLQFEEPEIPPLYDDIDPLEDTGQDVWIIWATARAIKKYMGNPNLRFINEYKAEYKYNHTLADADIAWVYVETYGGNIPEYHDEMLDLGIESIRYISIPGYYYCKMSGEQVVELAESWWVRRIYRVRTRYW